MQITVTFNDLKEVEEFTNRVMIGLDGLDGKDQKEPTKVTRKAKAESKQIKEPVKTEAEPVQEPEQKQAEEPAEASTPEPVPTDTYTLSDIQQKLAAFIKRGKGAIVKEILSSFGATQVTKIDPAKYGELMEVINAREA